MSGKYLRKRRPGLQDPTMTHVDDPQAFKVGDYIRDEWGYDLIVSIDDNMFDNPDIRFVHLIEWNNPISGGAAVHDVRENDRETKRVHMQGLIVAD